MFSRLIASGKRRMSWVRNPGVIVASVGVHVLILAGVVWAAGREGPPEPERPPEELTYIDITQLPPPPEEIFETPPPEAQAPAEAPPAAAQPSAAAPAPRAPAVPRTQPTTPPATDRQAGFQELRVPDPPAGIPAPDVSAPAVSAEDFGGRGAIGGVAGGTPVPPPPVTGTGGTGTGTGSGTGTGTGTGSGDGPPTGTFTANLVDSPARLTNPNDVARTLQRLYPENQRQAGITGRVVVELVVSAQGRVEPGSARVVSASDPAFRDVSLRAVEQFRFTPARVGPHAVRMRVQIPITWQLN